MSADRKLTHDIVGAWLVSCNPDIFDLTRAADKREPFLSWRLARNYRTDLVTVGDLVLLWVGGREKDGHIPGVWAHGLVAGDLEDDTGGDDWTDEEARSELRPYVPLLLTWLEPPLPKRQIQEHPALLELEILRMPRTANPSYLTPEEADALFEVIYAEYSAPVQSRLPSSHLEPRQDTDPDAD